MSARPVLIMSIAYATDSFVLDAHALTVVCTPARAPSSMLIIWLSRSA